VFKAVLGNEGFPRISSLRASHCLVKPMDPAQIQAFPLLSFFGRFFMPYFIRYNCKLFKF